MGLATTNGDQSMSETNKAKGSVLRKYIERVEDLRRQKKELSEEESLVWAECKSQGYAPGILKTIIKERSKRPADLEEEQALKDMYLDALGMKSEPPLFRAVGLMNVDPMARESVLAALSQIVPAQGDIILNMGGKPTRLWRGEDGEVLSEPWSPPVAAANSTENEPKSARDRKSVV